jgi:hypothetical protein
VERSGKRKRATFTIEFEKTRVLSMTASKRTGTGAAKYNLAVGSGSGGPVVARLSSNFRGTDFVLTEAIEGTRQAGRELAAVVYAPPSNEDDPRSLTIILPPYGNPAATATPPTLLLQPYKAGNRAEMVVLKNKAPVWREQTKTNVLNFHGRVKLPSMKNFQIIDPLAIDDVLMQFGRCGEDTFILDFKYPLTMLQAFGIALTSFN